MTEETKTGSGQSIESKVLIKGPTKLLGVPHHKPYVAPWYDCKAVLVERIGKQEPVIERTILDLGDFYVEVAYVQDKAVIIRAGQESLWTCEDYGGILLDEQNNVKGVVIGDGVGSTPFSQLVVYEVISGIIDEMYYQTKNCLPVTEASILGLAGSIKHVSQIDRKKLCEMIEAALDKDSELQKYRGTISHYIERAKQDKEVGQTTFLGAVLEEKLLHGFRLGDGGYVVVGEDKIVNVNGYFAQGAPPVIGLGRNESNGKDCWGWAKEPEYKPIIISEGDIAAFYTDGCMKKDYKTSQDIGEKLVSLRSQHHDLRELGIAFFNSLVDESKTPLFQPPDYKCISDDAILVLVKK
ncbi:hypothetical protein HY636_06350 [Candidatus Woesearchaeota archaeon]|nr:hypothetical protein [Candidatus Woesearchaeota archaeon]